MNFMQSLHFKVRNNFGAVQRIAGIFSRRGIPLLGFTLNEGEEHIAGVFVEFEGDEKLRGVMEKQFGKMLDFIAEGDLA